MFASLRRSVLLVLTGVLLTSAAAAQTNRSAVSVTGNDAASCTVPDPCRTFAVALSVTNPNGEVVALTSGGYGPFTIDKPATIVAAPGIYAALVAAAPLQDAILVNAGAGAKVVIRGLHLYGMGTGRTGISATGTGEEVHVEHCVIDGFVNFGINASMNVRVSDTTIRRCLHGIWFQNLTTPVKGTINRVAVRDMTNHGIVSSTNANVTVRDSIAADCASVGFYAISTGQLNVENSLATNNNIGVRVEGGVVRVSNTMATGNDIGFQHFNNCCAFVSWGNNKVRGNTTDISGGLTVVVQD